MRSLTDKVENALLEADYPADKDALLGYAQANDADDEVVRALKGLPPVEYGSREEVLRSVNADPGDLAGQTVSEKARQSREQAESRIPEHLRDDEPTPIEDEVGYNARS